MSEGTPESDDQLNPIIPFKSRELGSYKIYKSYKIISHNIMLFSFSQLTE